MPGEFEQEMQDRMQDFRISPGPQVWKQVENALPPEQRKRRFIFWWLLPLGLLIAGGIWYAAGNKKQQAKGDKQLAATGGLDGDTVKILSSVPKPLGDTGNTNNQAIASPATKAKPRPLQLNPVIAEVTPIPVITPVAPVAIKEKSFQQIAPNVKPADQQVRLVSVKKQPGRASQMVQLQVEANSKTVIAKPAAMEPGKVVLITPEKVEISNTPVVLTDAKVTRENKPLQPVGASATVDKNPAKVYTSSITILEKDQQKKLVAGGKADSSSTRITTTVTETNILKEEEIKPGATSIITTNKPVVENKVDSTVTAVSENNPAAQSSTQKKKSLTIEWQIFAAAGSSNAKDRLFGSQNKTLSYATAITQGSGSTTANYSPLTPTPGFSYAVGAQRLQSLGRHWHWYLNMQYSFMSNHQKTGARKDSAISVFDNSGLFNSGRNSYGSVPGFYYPGSSMNHTNTVHQLGLQTGLQYTIKPLAKRPFSLRAGVTLNQQLATNQLLYDAGKNAYYHSAAATNYFTFGTQLGLDWKLSKRLTLGVFYQYNFTRINKVEMGAYLHWQITGVRVAIPLRKH